MAKKIINLPILAEKWLAAWTRLKDYFANGTFAEKFIRHDEKPFVRWYDAGNRLYREFPDEEKMNAWVEAYKNDTLDEHPEIRAYEFTDGFTAPAPYTISFMALKDNQYVLMGENGMTEGVTIGFSFKTVDGNGSELPESVDAYYTFRSTSGTHQTTKIYNAGTEVSMNIDEFLHLGTNTITITLRGRSTGATRTVVVTYYVVQLNISTTFDISRSIQPETNFSVTYTVTGQADKTVRFYIDGVIVGTANISQLESTATRTQIFSNSDGHLLPGKHTLQVQAEMMAGDSIFTSNLLYYEFIITGIEQTAIMIQNVFPKTQPVLVGEQPGLVGKQYVTKSIDWAYYSSDVMKQSAVITWRLFANGNETALATRNADVVHAETDRKPDPLTFMPTEFGSYELQALIDNELILPVYTIAISENTEIYETKEGLTMKLSGLGRSNEEPPETLASWADRGYSCEFTNMPFNASAGYVDDAVVFNGGATGLINNKPFAEEVAVQSRNGNTVVFDFMSFNVDDEDAVILQIGNNLLGSGACLTIYPTRAVLRSNAGATITARFKADERVRLAFITHPNDASHTQYPRMMMVQNNGVLAPAVVYDITDNFNVGRVADTEDTYGMIKIGNADAKAGIKVYNILTYNATINDVQELNNAIIETFGDMASMIAKNDIYQTGSVSSVDIDKLEGMVPLVKITGDVTPLINTQSKATINGGMEITFPESPELNIRCEAAQFSNAGQSTLGLHMPPSMHVKLDKNNNVVYDRDGKPLSKNRWAFRAGNIPEKKFRLQANPMDSSCCHNGSFLRMVNETYRKAQVNGEYVLRIPAQQYVLSGQYAADMAQAHGGEAKDYEFPYTINYCPDSRPCVVVWRADENTPYTMLGLYVIMEEKKSDFAKGMRSIYDKIAPDGTLDPYDFKSGTKGNRIWNNEGCRQMENLRNHIYTFFTSSQDWDNDPDEREVAYEMIYPDPEDVIADGGDPNDYWEEFGNEMVKPIAATYDDQAAFDAIIFSIIDKWHTAAYYSRVLRNTCSDSLVRNLEWTRYEVGGKWIPKWWDVDMQLGLQQSGACDAEPMTDRNTKINGVYVLSGRDNQGNSSWLWDALEQNEEFMDAVRKIDQALYQAGWTYANMTDMQDKEFVQKWSQALYNKDGMTKYIETYLSGNDYLHMFQGDRTSHRHWFVRTSYDYWDSKWGVGEFKSKHIYVRAIGASKLQTMHFVAGATSYFGYGITDNVILSGIQANKGDAFDLELQNETPFPGNDPIEIYSCNKLETVDLHEIAFGMWNAIEVGECYDEVTGTILKKLVVGVSKEDMANGILNLQTTIAFSGLNRLSRLEWFDIQGLTGIKSIDLSAMVNLKKFYAAGSGLLSFNPAAGANFDVVELPLTIASIVANGVSFTDSHGNCAVTWWDNADAVTMPNTLLVLRLSGMGSDDGTHQLVHEWCEMLRDNPSLINSAQIQYRNIYWEGVDVDDLLTLAQIPAAQRELTGYVKASQEYTTEEMAALMEGFGDNIFSLANATVGLCCDCDSNNIIVSASGENVSVDSQGVIEVLQGTTAQLQAVGFPLLGDEPVYTWWVWLNGEYQTGSDFAPNVPFGHSSLHYRTGAITTTECSDDDLQYNIYVERNTGGSGTATIRVKKRTYPTLAEVELVHSSAPVSELEGVLQIITNGLYTFNANHKRIVNDEEVPFTGRMTEQDGGVWTLVGANSDYVARYTEAYLEGRTSFDEYRLQVGALPLEDLTMTLQYQSHWRNGLTLTAAQVEICLSPVIYNVLTTSLTAGNLPLFNAVAAAGATHEDLNSFNSMELKQLTGTLAIEDLITPSELLSFQNASYNVLQFLKNVTALDLTNCTGLTALALAPMTWLVTLKVKNCTGLVVIDLAAQTRMTTLPQEAYKGCSALMTVVCPTSLLSIGQDAFANTDAMLEVKCTADRVLTGLADSGIVASKGSIFVNDDRVASYTGLEETVEPVSDWNKPALMWGDGTRIRFGSGETVLIEQTFIK